MNITTHRPYDDQCTVLEKNVRRPSSRNSSFEILRIIAMYLIVASHHVLLNDFSVSNAPLTLEQFIYACTFSFGKIGVIIFFGISAWFLCEKSESSLRQSLKRIWILERQVLFYSIVMLLVFISFDTKDLGSGTIIKSFAPTATGLWWYVTSYVIFLLFLPFLDTGLRRMSANLHGQLCLVLIAIWGIGYGLLPSTTFGFQSYSFVGFFYVYVLISFYRRHMHQLSAKTGWGFIAGGAALFLVSTFASDAVYWLTGIGKFHSSATFMGEQFKLPVVMIGFGCILVASHVNFTSTTINRIASTTFGVYLIHQYPSMVKWLGQVFDIGHFYDKPYALVLSLAISVLVFVSCALIDFVRQLLFTVTIDKNRGKWFEILWGRCSTSVIAHHIHHLFDQLSK